MMHAPQHVSDAEDLRRKCTQQHAEFVREQAKNDALRAQLAALAEEHEVLTHHARITDANLALLVEKVLAFDAAERELIDGLERDDDNTCEREHVNAATLYEDLLDLARSLKP